VTDKRVVTMDGPLPPVHRLQPDAIGITQDTVIGMASSAPAATSGLTLALLAGAAAYGAAGTLILSAIPIMVIANAYRRLNQWNANCSASFEWVGRAINPYLGYITGWLMLTYYVIGGVALIVPLGPSVLQAFGTSTSSPWPNLAITSVVVAVMLVIAVVGIRPTARTQIGMAVVEYTILVGIAIAGLIFVAGNHPGTVHLSWAWLSPTGIGGRGSLANGFLISAFVIAGWDGTMYVNEEVRHRRTNPGRAAMWAAGLLFVIYTLVQVGLQGVVSPARLQAHSAAVLVFTTQAFAGPGWGKVMAAAVALSVIATTGVGIALTARIMFGMASWQALPPFLANVSRRFATPVAASVLTAVLLLGLFWTYSLATSLANVFGDLLSISSWLTLGFYILTALAMTIFYRRQIFTSARHILTVGVLPLASSAFLAWVVVRSFQLATSAQRWSLTAVLAVGVVLMLLARFVWRSPFFRVARESDNSNANTGR
jgi:amino acid transporter